MTLAKVFHAVVVYDVSQQYGGPEEGGWWYDDGDIDHVDVFTLSEEAAEKRAIALNGRFNSEREQRAPYSGKVATIIQVPRTEREFDHERCHLDSDQLGDEVTRWDIPSSYLDKRRPHYC